MLITHPPPAELACSNWNIGTRFPTGAREKAAPTKEETSRAGPQTHEAKHRIGHTCCRIRLLRPPVFAATLAQETRALPFPGGQRFRAAADDSRWLDLSPAGRGPGLSRRIVGLHGCSGMFRPRHQHDLRRFIANGPAELTRHPALCFCWFRRASGRGSTARCARSTASTLEIYRRRPRDAYGALWYLQGATLCAPQTASASPAGHRAAPPRCTASGRQSPASPEQSHCRVEFRAAVAVYPGSLQRAATGKAGWGTAIPLLVLMGAEDVWTPVAPCRTFLDGAIARGNA